MTDQWLAQPAVVVPLAAAEATRRFPQKLQPRVVWVLTILIICAIALYSWISEGQPAGALFVTAVAVTIGALVVFVSRRVLLAAVIVTTMLALLHIFAVLKQQTTDVTLHAYDVISFVRSSSAIASVWHHHRHFTIALSAGWTTAVLIAWIAYRLDSTRVRRAHSVAAVAMFSLIVWIGASLQDARGYTGFYYEERPISFFLSSWSEASEAWWRGNLIDAAPQASGPKLSIPTKCELTSKPPHIILVHQESVVPPSHFPTLSYDRKLDPFFRSYDGKLHKLRVETYGGASWLPEFSVLTGLSARSFGNLQQFVQTIMANKLRDALPQALARCGYHNVAFHPMLRIYLSIDKFLVAVGVHKIFDAKDQLAKIANERDRFYYSNALAHMERHFKTSSQPLFTFIETMATHGPYSYTYMPEVDVAGGGSGTDPEMHEYLRRLAMAQQDYSFFRVQLARRFPSEKFLIVNYGDHQPFTTMPLLGFNNDATITDVMSSRNDAAFITYYAIDAVHYHPSPPPDLATLDVPYLGTIILEAARLPLSDVYRERKRLMALCDGRYYGCSKRDEILQFHRRLINSNIVDPL